MPVRFYNAASSECFGETDANGANELTPFRPKSPYAVAKAAAFWTVANYRESYELYACSGILFNHESPLRPKRFVTKKIIYAAYKIASGSQEKLHLGNLSIKRDWGWAPEYVVAMHLMLQQDTPEDFVIATGECYSLEEFVSLAFAAFDLDWQKYVVSDHTLFRPSDIFFGKGNPQKAYKQLGWKAKYTMPDIIQLMKLEYEQGLL
jgi:GDPmannose 4,6-dehydratase